MVSRYIVVLQVPVCVREEEMLCVVQVGVTSDLERPIHATFSNVTRQPYVTHEIVRFRAHWVHDDSATYEPAANT